MKGFVDFIREQGVVGLAIGFILGGAVSTVVSSLVEDIINPIIGLALGSVGTLSEWSLAVGQSEIMIGNFIAVIIDFLVIAAVVYFGFKALKLDRSSRKASDDK